eukprot:CAMPEP_0113951546 /NCGR_PEP_ID=MMETSP1339-20121228/86735_1 /TAXON_ID=94617 /ORGANISM="Fibrocapsa japonica" /LENGTH=235 /DNA_ID=CAMNT_0000959843 /DNA_START=200 /DNA_END=907 /DNA_ORIENTATION=- /assembly_acc=CAM_ASM_000762
MTKVICTISGPHAISRADDTFSEQGQLRVDLRYAPFARVGQSQYETNDRDRRDHHPARQTDGERDASALIRQALEASIQMHLLPKSLIDVYIWVLQADGGELGAAVTCASLALSDAGIELFDLVVGCSVGCLGGSRVLLDPTEVEISQQRAPEDSSSGGARGGKQGAKAGVMTVTFTPASQEVTQWWQEGQFDQESMARGLALCIDGCLVMHKIMKEKLVECFQAYSSSAVQAQL